MTFNLILLQGEEGKEGRDGKPGPPGEPVSDAKLPPVVWAHLVTSQQQLSCVNELLGRWDAGLVRVTSLICPGSPAV